jgi:transcriptional regulator with XRE-family HTH domain
MRKSYPKTHRSQSSTSTPLGAMLRQRRLNEHLSLNQLAQQVNVTRQYLSRLETGAYQHPSPVIITRLARALDISQADLFAAAGHTLPEELPEYLPYLQAKHMSWPKEAIRELQQHFEYVRFKYRLDNEQSNESSEITD